MGLPIGQGCPPLHTHARRAAPSRSCNRSAGMACLFCRQPKCCLQNKQFRRKKISTGTPPAARVISPLHNLWASPQAKIPRSFRALFWDRAFRTEAPRWYGWVRREDNLGFYNYSSVHIRTPPYISVHLRTYPYSPGGTRQREPPQSPKGALHPGLKTAGISMTLLGDRMLCSPQGTDL